MSAPTLSPSAPEADGDRFVRQHLRLNLFALGSDLAFYMVGLTFASQTTILPAFAAFLGASNVVIGAIPAATTLGWMLPSLFVAGHTETLGRKLPFVLRYTAWERAPYLALALAAFLFAERAPASTLVALLLVLLVTTGVGGALLPAWMDIVGHAIPVTMRGRFFAVANVAGSLGGLVASFATATILGAIAPPASYGLCFVAASLCMGVSYVALLLTREPPASTPPAPRAPVRAYLRRMPALLRGNPNMVWFLAARGSSVVGVMASGFFIVYALRVLGAPPRQVGVYTTMLLAGQVVGNLLFGWWADWMGHRLVLAAGAAAMSAANLVALLAPSVAMLDVVFVLDGVADAAIFVSGLAILLEMAPVAGERPTYVGLGRTAIAPLAFGAPLAAGVLIDLAGFSTVFAVAAGFSLLGLALLVLRVREPRSEAIGEPSWR